MENPRKWDKSKIFALLGIIGLVVGIIGLSLGSAALVEIANLKKDSDDSHTHNGWYKRLDSAVYTAPNFTVIPITALTITFELGLNEAVYVSYMGEASLVPQAGSSFVGITFRVDGAHLFFPYITFGVSNMTADSQSSPITLQLYKDDLPEGAHNVTIDILGSHDSNYVNLNTLYVQKYPL
ncbi:MAG: hypothetical protein ACFFAI_13255 [Promethearchaeota archaeon]